MSMGPWESGFQLRRYFRISSSVGVGIQSKEDPSVVSAKTGMQKIRKVERKLRVATRPVRRISRPDSPRNVGEMTTPYCILMNIVLSLDTGARNIGALFSLPPARMPCARVWFRSAAKWHLRWGGRGRRSYQKCADSNRAHSAESHVTRSVFREEN